MKTILVAVLAAALFTVGCDSPDVRTIEQDLDAQAQAQESMRQRISDLETTLNALSGESGSDQQELRTVTERLSALEDALDALSVLLSEEKAAREAEDGAATEQRASFDSRLDSLESTVSTLQRQLNDLQNLVNALQARLDNHESNHP